MIFVRERVAAFIFYMPALGLLLYYITKFVLLVSRMIKRKLNNRNSTEHYDSGHWDNNDDLSALFYRTM